jgi:aspartate aminotransferase-like enzyme
VVVLPIVLQTGRGNDGASVVVFVHSSWLPSLQTYGANIDQIKAEIGGAVKEADIENALQAKKYKIVTVTHVDTSTG